MIKKVVLKIEETSLRFPFIKRVVRIDETENTVKYRLIIEEDLFVQVYVNVENDTVGFVLINKGQRIYGRDSICGKWHRHTFELHFPRNSGHTERLGYNRTLKP
ncbi:MAG: hypothetical protein HZB54_09560 [Deltaproteobacteria bacterium]|nr:hypothetical protein [Deltaproteobacteria bacterium]